MKLSIFRSLILAGQKLVLFRLSGRVQRLLLVSFVFVLFLVRGVVLWGLITSGPVANMMNQYLAEGNDILAQISSQLSGFSLTISDQGLNASSMIRIQKPVTMTGKLPQLLFVLDTRSNPQPAEWVGNDGHQALVVMTKSLVLINTGFLDPGPMYTPQLRLESFTTPVILTQSIIEPVLAKIKTRSEPGRNFLISSMKQVLGLMGIVVSLMGGLFGGTILLVIIYIMTLCINLLLRVMGISTIGYDISTIVLFLLFPVSIVAYLLGLHRGHSVGIVLLITIGLLWWHTQHMHDEKTKKSEDTSSLGL